jgi:serine/threonine protein kinase
VALTAGQRLGPYEILAPLGAGGMGEVYRARDAKLDREVAVKVLPAPLAQSEERRERFEREAKTVAGLSHPNILAIHDFGAEGGISYAVMELLEGETLRERLAGGPLPARRAADYAHQVAEGLAAAHEKGVVHRDLKPENLFVTADGRVKILDFGLARIALPPLDTGDTRSPTLVRATEPGTVLGTVGYMAPEQVRGETVDHRADLFAFGAVLYEMLTGRRAFARDTAAETMTAILREDPPGLSPETSGIPPRLGRLVQRCLDKRASDRFQSARDLAFALSEPGEPSGQMPSVGGGRTRRSVFSSLRVPLAMLFAGAALGAGAMRLRTSPLPAGVPSIRYLTGSGRDFSPSASPDGRTIAFRSDRDGRARIWVKQLATGTEMPLTSGPVDDWPRFSPDGSTILFTRQGRDRPTLFRVPFLGGESRRVLDDAADAEWSPDGQRIVFLRSTRSSSGPGSVGSIHVAAADGSGGRELARFENAFLSQPRFEPGGRFVAVSVVGAGAGLSAIRRIGVDDASNEVLLAPDGASKLWGLLWTGKDQFVYGRGMIAVGNQPGLSGRLVRREVASGHETPLVWSADPIGRATRVGPDRLAFEGLAIREALTEWGLGKGETTGRHLSATRGSNRQPVYSPDGEWIAFSSDRSGNLDIWEISTRTGELRQLTDDPADDWDPGFTRDGKLLWSSNRTGHFECWEAEADGSGPRKITSDGVDAENPATTPDGRSVVYGSTRPGQQGLWRARIDGTEARLIVPGLVGLPEISPDGQYVAYGSFAGTTGGGPRGGWVRVSRLSDGRNLPFEIAPPAVRFAAVNLGRARWVPGGRAIAFLGQDERGVSGVFVQDFDPERDTSSTRRPLAGFDPETTAETFGLSPDGSRVAVAGRQLQSSILLAEGVAGLAR